MDVLGHVIVTVFIETHISPLITQRNRFTEAQLDIKNLVYFHPVAQYQYHIEVTLMYIVNNLGDVHCQTVDFRPVSKSKSGRQVSVVLSTQHTFDTQGEHEAKPGSNNPSTAAKSRPLDEAEIQIKSEIAQHLVNELDVNFVNLHLLNFFSYNIQQLGNLLNPVSEHPERACIEHKLLYQQPNCVEATFLTIQTKA